MENPSRQPEQSPAGKKKNKKKSVLSMMGKQGILLGSSMLLLITAVIYMTFAWYTRTANTGNAAFDMAQWDFSADHNIGDFVIDVNKYSNLKNGKAAPGSSGTIPIQISALHSDTAVNYRMSVKMLDPEEISPADSGSVPGLASESNVTLDQETLAELRERIQFYYKDQETGEVVILDSENIFFEESIPAGGKEIITLYWNWIYEKPVPMDDTGVKVTFPDVNTMTVTDSIGQEIKTFTKTDEKNELRNVIIEPENSGYQFSLIGGADETEAAQAGDVAFKDWRIVNYAGQTCTDYTQLSDAARELLMSDADTVDYFREYQEITDENNAFDTKIGRDPTSYEPYLKVQVHIEGIQAYPELEESTDAGAGAAGEDGGAGTAGETAAAAAESAAVNAVISAGSSVQADSASEEEEPRPYTLDFVEEGPGV